MSTLERWLSGLIVLAGLLALAVIGIHRYGLEQYGEGYDAALEAGDKVHQQDIKDAQRTEESLRAQLAARDTAAFEKEKEYASNLEAAKRRIRAGTDSLRCPAASSVPDAAKTGNRPAAGGLEVEPAGPSLMPESAADLLGVAADVAGLVRRYERLEQRFEDCRAVNSK